MSTHKRIVKMKKIECFDVAFFDWQSLTLFGLFLPNEAIVALLLMRNEV